MSEPPNLQEILAQAEHAATNGDLASADELLGNAALLQEHELGPLHPELANTLNNRAIIAEKAGRLDDAEAFYRRAVAIASASLAPDDPMVVASRQNLEDFCNAHGLPIDRPAAVSPPVAEEAPALPPPPPSPSPSLAAPSESAAATAAPSRSPSPSPPLSPPSPPVPAKASRAPAALAIGAIALTAAVLLMARPWSSSRQAASAPAPAPAAEPAPAPAGEPARPAPDAPPPPSRTPAPTPPSASVPKADRSATPSSISLIAVQLCRKFSTKDWRCEPAGGSVPPGPIVLYTRVRSPRDGVIVHRWYRGDSLRKSAQLRIAANAAEGYRTYSRQSVDRGDWRVEVRSAAGEVLHEQRLTVR
jgi:hypothetical protein